MKRAANQAAIGCAVLLLAGCAHADNTPAGECEREVYQDPAVKELIMMGMGNLQLQRANEAKLDRAKQQARRACLERLGVVRPGGVERLNLP